MKLEEEDVREEFSSYSSEFESIFGKYFTPDSTNDGEDREVWVNQDTGEVRDEEPTDDEKMREEHLKAERLRDEERQKKLKESRTRPEKVKRLYKKLASHLHPDKGGSDEQFQSLRDSYNNNDLIELLSLASKFDIEYEIDETDEKTFKKNLKSIESEIKRMKDTLAWVWSTGTPSQKKFVISKIELSTGKKIDKNDFKDLFESE